MLTGSFTWFYCLDFEEILALLLLLTAVFCRMDRKFGPRRSWKAAVTAAVVLWLWAVLAQTVLLRTPEPGYAAIWTPLESYRAVRTGSGSQELLRSNFMNGALFYPVGLLLASLLSRRLSGASAVLTVLTAAAVLSGAIEYAQYHWQLGVAQTDDILHNTLGAVLGAAALYIPWHKLLSPS